MGRYRQRSWTSRGTGTLVALTVLFVVIGTVGAVHVSSLAGRRQKLLTRHATRIRLAGLAREALVEAQYAFQAIVNERHRLKSDGPSRRCRYLCAQPQVAAFFGKSLAATPSTTTVAVGRHDTKRAAPIVVAQKQWAEQFRQQPRLFQGQWRPRWISRREDRDARQTIGEVTISCASCQQGLGVVGVRGSLRFAVLATARTDNGLVRRRYEVIRPFHISPGYSGVVTLDGSIAEVQIDRDILVGGRR